ncbi:hypothetical protein ACQ4LE_005128 [Meloidogyne hapla]
MIKLKSSIILLFTLIIIFINLINSKETNSGKNEGRIKRFGGWGGGTYRYGPCGYGGCQGGGVYGYGGGGGGGWMNMGIGYGMRPVGWRPWRTGGGGRHSHESHSKERYG